MRNLDLGAPSLLPLPCVTLEISPLLCERGQDNNASVITVGRSSVIDAGGQQRLGVKNVSVQCWGADSVVKSTAASRRPDTSSQNPHLTIHNCL